MSNKTRMPATGLSSTAFERPVHMSPNVWTQGTGLSSGEHTAMSNGEGTGMSTGLLGSAVSPAQVAFGARVIDLPGSPPRGAPV